MSQSVNIVAPNSILASRSSLDEASDNIFSIVVWSPSKIISLLISPTSYQFNNATAFLRSIIR